MQTPPTTSAETRSPDYGARYVVRLSGALDVALWGHENEEEVLCFEDELLGELRALTLALLTKTGGVAASAAASVLAALLRPGRGGQQYEEAVLGRLREAGLITYPSPLLGGLLEKVPEVFEAKVLPRLGCVDRTMLAQVGPPWHAAVLASRLSRTQGVVSLELEEFCTSVDRLAWAKANGCPWNSRVCIKAAGKGCLEVLKWARERGCPWETGTCAHAARGGHLAVLQWARVHHCPWNDRTTTHAAQGGHLDVLRWARDRGCPWSAATTHGAAKGGHLAVLQWAWAYDCPRNGLICEVAAKGGHLAVFSGRGSTTALGTRRLASGGAAKWPLGAGTWRCCSGRGSTAARGERGLVKMLLGTGTWRF